MTITTAVSHPNIAFIKYWGNRNDELRLPASSSLSMNLAGLQTRTAVEFDSSLRNDTLLINRDTASQDQQRRVSDFLDLVRQLASIKTKARITTESNFPSGAGIASSSSAFAALALAASTAAGLSLDEQSLSRLARRGSGSAARSVPSGFVVWQTSDKDGDSFGVSIAPPEHWALVDCIAIVSEREKAIGSTEGHKLAATSTLQAARLAGAPHRLELCTKTILDRDFSTLADLIELDCHLMHAVMMTSHPPLHYWMPASLAIMEAVRGWRRDGLSVCYTLDAGPNVHVLCPAGEADHLCARLEGIPGVIRVLRAGPGGPARIID